jgi:hypothetical protein
MVRVCQWDSTRSPARATKTVYGWLLEQPSKLQLLLNSKVVLSVTVQFESLRTAHVMHEDAGAAENGNDASSVIVMNEPAPAACVPRNALLYPANGPRPLPKLRQGESRTTEHDDYDAYVAQWAPKTGAQPCWPCPFCLTARHFNQTLYLYRHIRSNHADRGEVQNQHLRLKAISDVACLVWCFQPGGTSCHWEPVLQ